MTLTEDPDGRDLAPDDAELSTISSLSVGVPGTVPEAGSPAEQGDAPTDLADRTAPPVPVPSREGLSADEVARLTGDGRSATSANNALDRAEGVVPDAED